MLKFNSKTTSKISNMSNCEIAYYRNILQIPSFAEFFPARTADKKIMRNTFIECVQGDASTSAAKRARVCWYENCKKGWVGSINIWTANEFTFHNCLFIKHKFVRKAQLSGTYFDWCWLNANIEAAAWRCCRRRRRAADGWVRANEQTSERIPQCVCVWWYNECLRLMHATRRAIHPLRIYSLPQHALSR